MKPKYHTLKKKLKNLQIFTEDRLVYYLSYESIYAQQTLAPYKIRSMPLLPLQGRPKGQQ